MKKFVYSALALLVFIGCSSEQADFNKALSLFESESYSEAFALFEKAAKSGHAGAQAYLGECYMEGYGTLTDKDSGKFWILKAADQKDAHALCMYGDIVYWEDGGDEAKVWYLRAAEQNSVKAMACLGSYYESKRDYEEATKWYLKADKMDEKEKITNIDAQMFLGDCYFRGVGVEQNYAKTVEYYERALDFYSSNKLYQLGFCYYYGSGVNKDEEKAIKYFISSVELDNNIDAKKMLDKLGVALPDKDVINDDVIEVAID